MVTFVDWNSPLGGISWSEDAKQVSQKGGGWGEVERMDSLKPSF